MVNIVMRLSRNELFSGLFILACANGLITRVEQTVDQFGLFGALFRTFDISVIVLAGCSIGVVLVFRDRRDAIRSNDLAVTAILLLLISLPIVALSWLAVTLLSLYILCFTNTAQASRRGAIILLATTVPMFWSRMLFDLFTRFILNIDAALVAWILGTERNGNIVEFYDHSGSLAIWPGCSSLANMSLAFLCWVAISQSVRHIWRPADLIWGLLACASVIAINVTRVSLMGLSRSNYEAIHSHLGDQVTGMIILILTIGISVLGVKREIFSRT